MTLVYILGSKYPVHRKFWPYAGELLFPFEENSFLSFFVKLNLQSKWAKMFPFCLLWFRYIINEIIMVLPKTEGCDCGGSGVVCDVTVPLALCVCVVIWRMQWWTSIMVTQSPGTTWVPCCHKCVRSCSSSCSRTLTAPWASVPAAFLWCCRVLLTTNTLLHSSFAHLQSYRLSRAPTPSLALAVQLTLLCSVAQTILSGLCDGSCSPDRDTVICFMTALHFPSSPPEI